MVYHLTNPVGDNVMMLKQASEIRGRMAQLGVTQQELAIAMGYERSAITRYLTGARPMPEGFEARVHAALNRLERVKRAGQDAESRAMTHELTHSPESPVPGCEWCQESHERVLAEGLGDAQ